MGFETPYAWLDVNNRDALKHATRFLLDLVHRRIAAINVEAMDFAHRRRSGYTDAINEHGNATDATLMRGGEMAEVFRYSCAREMLTAPNAPTAIATSSLISALGTRRAVEE